VADSGLPTPRNHRTTVSPRLLGLLLGGTRISRAGYEK
jgi:hypothetical protein